MILSKKQPSSLRALVVQASCLLAIWLSPEKLAKDIRLTIVTAQVPPVDQASGRIVQALASISARQSAMPSPYQVGRLCYLGSY